MEPWTEGAASLEGTLAFAGGESLLALYILGIGLLGGWACVGIATLAAFLAKNEERLIGATLQEKTGLEWMTNKVVNYINTVIGATIALFSP